MPAEALLLLFQLPQRFPEDNECRVPRVALASTCLHELLVQLHLDAHGSVPQEKAL
jgi:hypothetical protein